MAPRPGSCVLLLCMVATTLALLPGYSGKSGRRVSANSLFMPDFTEECLGCVCDATSNCNLTIGCVAGLCGPFLISRYYWEDAGAPVLAGDNWARQGAYEACTNDPYCATNTIFNYMSRYAQDCNGDGILDCDDYARIHYLGGNQCRLPIRNYAYYRVFKRCRAGHTF